PQMFIYQPALERVIREGVERFPSIEVRLEQEMVDLRQDRDGVAVVSTTNPLPWPQQASFSTSAADAGLLLDRTLQARPAEGLLTLRDVEGALRVLSGQGDDRLRVFLLITNQPLAGLTTPAGELEAIRTTAEEQGIQLSVLNLPTAVSDGGMSQVLVQRTPGGRVAYASSATSAAEISPHLGVLLAPAMGARFFEIGRPGAGTHNLVVTVPGGGAQASTSVSVPSGAGGGREGLIEAALIPLVVALCFASGGVVYLLLRNRMARLQLPGTTNEFPPFLHLRPIPEAILKPEVIEFPAPGKKLRIGYHPPHMDNVVGHVEFARLPYQDIRGDPEIEKGISRHVASIWRDKATNDCYIQLGWPGPGEPIRPREQTQVLDSYGRPQDATSQPYRLKLNNVVRLSSSVEYVFKQFLLSDKTTEVEKKISAFSDSRQPVA
ncbi:MAG TPA: hypothetical protein VHS99_25300, partial [Chloroflexota bacterium]|nr:hypothetical protein [Chloroflexota bacterium]